MMVAPKEQGEYKVKISHNLLSVLEVITCHGSCCICLDPLKSPSP